MKFFNKKTIKKTLKIILIIIISLTILALLLSYRKKPEDIKYGVSFNVPYAIELELDWKKVYIATMDELGAKRLRLAAHWPLIEPNKDQYNFVELDFQLEEARKRDVDVILAVGRRLPRWPECHVPEWAMGMSDDEWQAEIEEYLELVVNRYKGYENIIYWQVENEPFLEVFAYEHCGDLDVDFLEKEIALVKSLDDSRPILVTDSGNLGTWTGAYSRGDAFGTSVYLYFWNPHVGRFKSILPPEFYIAKANIMKILHGKKDTFLIELSLEPWLIEPLVTTPIEVQLERMDLVRMKDIIQYAEQTRLEFQYLWGVEWWYWMKENGNPELWDYTKTVFQNSK